MKKEKIEDSFLLIYKEKIKELKQIFSKKEETIDVPKLQLKKQINSKKEEYKNILLYIYYSSFINFFIFKNSDIIVVSAVFLILFFLKAEITDHILEKYEKEVFQRKLNTNIQVQEKMNKTKKTYLDLEFRKIWYLYQMGFILNVMISIAFILTSLSIIISIICVISVSVDFFYYKSYLKRILVKTQSDLNLEIAIYQSKRERLFQETNNLEIKFKEEIESFHNSCQNCKLEELNFLLKELKDNLIPNTYYDDIEKHTLETIVYFMTIRTKIIYLNTMIKSKNPESL